jgi:4-amino-4-deoxy-L-arabinose transferase-like glycosyltransferase
MESRLFEPTRTSGPQRRFVLLWYSLATLLAVFTYFYALDSDHAPTNGDEYPYAHITRLTAASGHLLPLQSDFVQMRNTKPPLLFWQGIASTNWAQHWTLARLRYPSVLYTLLTGLLLFLLGWKLSGARETGFLALLTFLAFFSTYRYGRPFLTNPPEVFWLFLPFFVLLYWKPAAFGSRWMVPGLLGVAIGVGLLYKSFALVVPVTLALAWWYLHQQRYQVARFVVRDARKVAVAAILSLALFSLWFVFAPDREAIFKEFVLGENLKKFDPHGPSYLAKLLWGGSSVWRLVLSYPLNAGLLAFPVVALFVIAWQRRRAMADEEKLLWIWVFTLFLVFSLPSQRDERYLLSGMPALALLCALNWHRISRILFVATLAAAGVVLALLGYLSLRLEQYLAGTQVYPVTHWLLLIGTAALILLALFSPRLTTPLLNVAVLLVFLSFADTTRPLDTRFGLYSREAQEYARGKDVWVPTNFKAKEEGYRFFLPGANPHPYRYQPGMSVADLSAQHPLFAIWLPMNSPAVTGGKVIGERLRIGSRHSASQIKEMLRGKVFEILFVKEFLIEAPGPTAAPDSISAGGVP